MAQITNITSEALQATIRRLLPSQQGFGEDLQASNVITPIIDLTPTAEGSQLPAALQTAINFTDATAFKAQGSTVSIISTPGFYRIFGTSANRASNGVDAVTRFTMSDGLSSKTVWEMDLDQTGQEVGVAVPVDFVVFLQAGESISAVAPSGNSCLAGSARQIADVNGILTNPTGFNPQ